jgi:Predicted nucleotidyltransferases
MSLLPNLQLPQLLREALQAARERISAEFAVDRIVLFGSVVRGEADEESDVDLLVVLKEPPDHKIRNRISKIILDVNLEYDTNLSGLVVEQQAWDEGPLSVLPIHGEIDKEGVRL